MRTPSNWQPVPYDQAIWIISYLVPICLCCAIVPPKDLAELTCHSKDASTGIHILHYGPLQIIYFPVKVHEEKPCIINFKVKGVCEINEFNVKFSIKSRLTTNIAKIKKAIITAQKKDARHNIIEDRFPHQHTLQS